MSLADQQWSPTSAQVTVHQARGLRIKGKSGTNDAYAVMQVGKEKFQTSVVEKSVAPVWKEEALFDLPPPPHQGAGGGGGGGGTLHVHVLHRALVGPDKLLGQAVINLLQLSEDKTRNKTEWFKLLDKTGKPDKDRGEVLVDIQFLRNNMTASMFDLSAAGKSRSRLGKFKDKVRGKKKESDTSSNVVPSLTQVLTDSEEEGHEDEGVSAGKDEKKKKLKIKSLFSPKSNLQRNMSQSMSVLPAKNSSVSGSLSSGLNVDTSEGKKKFKFKIHKRTGSSDSKDSSVHQKHAAAEQSNLCINGSHIYCEEPQPRTSRIGSNYSLASSGHGSMEDVPDSSPPSVDSLRALRQYSPWTEEEEEEATAVNPAKEEVGELKRKEEDRMEEERKKEAEDLERLAKERMRQEEEEENRKATEEMAKRKEEERIRRAEEDRVRREEEEELQRIAEEKKRREEKMIEEEKVKREEEERKMREEEERKRREEEECERLAEEKRRREEQERWKAEEEERQKRDEEERTRLEREREQEEMRKKEEEEIARRLGEERQLEEEKRKLKEEEERRRIEEERAKKEEEERIRGEERAVEEWRRREEEEMRRRQEEKRELEEQEREMRRREEEARIKREEEEKVRKEREEYRRAEEEKRKQEEEEKKKIEAEEEKRKKEEERIRLEEEREAEEQEKRRIEEEEKRQKEERIKIEEERVRKEREEYERVLEERLRQEELERRRTEEEEKARKDKERIERERKRREEEEEQERIERERKRREEEEEQERIKRERKRREEEEEQERIERERKQREEEEEQERIERERKRREEEEEQGRMDRERKRREEEEEQERIERERKRREEEEEQERIERERKRREEEEEQERIEREKKRREDEERVSKEMAEMERLAEEKRRLEEEEKMRIEKEENMKREEEERIREKEKKEEEARRLEKEKLEREAEEQKKDKMKPKPSGRKVDFKFPAEATSTNPFDENYSSNPFEEIPSSPTELDRCQSTASMNEKDLISSQRGKRTAPRPPGKTQAERQTQKEQDVSASCHLSQMNKQSKDKNAKTVSLIPKRSVKNIAPVKGSATGSENTQNSTLNGTTKVATSMTKLGKRVAPPPPSSVESPLKPTQACDSNISKTKEEPVYGLNPFEEEEEDEPTAQNDTTVESNSGSVQWPLPDSQAAEKDVTSQMKMKSSKMVHAPPLPATKTDTSIKQSTEGGLITEDVDSNEALDPKSEPISLVHVKETESQHATVQITAEEAGGKKEVPPPAPRRLQPVKPLNSLEQQSLSVVHREKEIKSTGIPCEVQEKTKVNNTGIKGPYSQLTQQELISMVLKQENQLKERDKKISELELYIDDLLVRVIDEAPTILQSINSLKKAV